MRWSFCKACERFLGPERTPWHSHHHPEMSVNEWTKECWVQGAVILPGTELAPVCPNSKCAGRNILDVVLVPQGAKAECHIMSNEGDIIADNVCWDGKFEQPPEEHRYWCQDCEAYINPEWEKVK